MTFDDLMALAKYKKQTFGREVRCATYRIDDKVLAVTHMHDDFHDMRLAMLVDEKMEIHEVACEMERIPYGSCLEVPPRYETLKGMSIFQKGVLKEIRARIPREQGCVHVFEMLESTLRSLFAAISSHRGEYVRLNLDRDESQQLAIANPILRNTCWSFNDDGKNEETLGRALKKLAGEKVGPIIR